MKDKKILFFIAGSYVSGLEIVTLHLIGELKNRGYDVRCLVTGWNDGVFKKKLDDLNVQYYEVKLGWVYFKKPLWTADTLINYPKAYFFVKRILREFKPDVCHFCGFTMLIMLYPLIRQKSVYNLQEPHLPTSKHLFIYKLLNKKISCFTAVSNHIVNVLKNLNIPDSKISLVFNGIPPVTEKVIESINNRNVLRFAIIGQIVEWKGHGTLLRAVKALTEQKQKEFVISIFGNDKTEFALAFRKQIQAYGLEKYFSWKGYVGNQEEIYKECEVVIVPSLSEEPCSLTIIEAMTRGKGLIVSDRGGNKELVQDKQNGLVFKAEEHTDLSKQMKLFLNDSDFLHEMSVRAKMKATENYTSKSMTDHYEKVYSRICQK